VVLSPLFEPADSAGADGPAGMVRWPVGHGDAAIGVG
jgi:hypothetical protein